MSDEQNMLKYTIFVNLSLVFDMESTENVYIGLQKLWLLAIRTIGLKWTKCNYQVTKQWNLFNIFFSNKISFIGFKNEIPDFKIYKKNKTFEQIRKWFAYFNMIPLLLMLAIERQLHFLHYFLPKSDCWVNHTKKDDWFQWNHAKSGGFIIS